MGSMRDCRPIAPTRKHMCLRPPKLGCRGNHNTPETHWPPKRAPKYHKYALINTVIHFQQNYQICGRQLVHNPQPKPSPCLGPPYRVFMEVGESYISRGPPTEPKKTANLPKSTVLLSPLNYD